MRRQESAPVGLTGVVTVKKFGPHGDLRLMVVTHNLTTAVGDQMYAERGANVTGMPSAPTGMKLGTGDAGATPPAKTGAGAALVTYLTGSAVAFDFGYPQSGVVTILGDNYRAISYQCTWAAGQATSIAPVTEVVMVNEVLSDATSLASATVSRAALSAPVEKDPGEILTIEWSHRLRGT